MSMTFSQLDFVHPNHPNIMNSTPGYVIHPFSKAESVKHSICLLAILLRLFSACPQPALTLVVRGKSSIDRAVSSDRVSSHIHAPPPKIIIRTRFEPEKIRVICLKR